MLIAHSTEVAFALLIQLPWVQFLARQSALLSQWTVSIKRERTHLVQGRGLQIQLGCTPSQPALKKLKASVHLNRGCH